MLYDFSLKRISANIDGTFGVLIDKDIPFCLTVERPWLDNRSNVSCIPTGDYVCKRVISPKFGNTFEITHVPSRSQILFHKGNVMDDSHGCVIVGEQFEYLGTRVAVLSSGKAFAEFLDRTELMDSFKLSIT